VKRKRRFRVLGVMKRNFIAIVEKRENTENNRGEGEEFYS
jgi:hypothetical protein